MKLETILEVVSNNTKVFKKHHYATEEVKIDVETFLEEFLSELIMSNEDIVNMVETTLKEYKEEDE